MLRSGLSTESGGKPALHGAQWVAWRALEGCNSPQKVSSHTNSSCIWSGPIKLSAISSACCTTLHCVLFECTQQRLPVCCILLYAAGLILVASMWGCHMRHTLAPDSSAVLLGFDADVQTRCHPFRHRRAEQSRSMMLGRRVYFILCCTVLCSGTVVISRSAAWCTVASWQALHAWCCSFR